MNDYQAQLKQKMDDYVHLVYRVSKNFPKDEQFGATSQLRRATLSVILNYIEGYARNGDKTRLHFLKISYGSLQESKYLIEFTARERYLENADFKAVHESAEEIGAMLWTELTNLSKNII